MTLQIQKRFVDANNNEVKSWKNAQELHMWIEFQKSPLAVHYYAHKLLAKACEFCALRPSAKISTELPCTMGGALDVVSHNIHNGQVWLSVVIEKISD